MKSVLAGPCIS